MIKSTSVRYTEFEKEFAKTLYKLGLSTRQVSKITGIHNSQVYRICKSIVRSHFKPDSTHWRTCRARARRLVEKKLKRRLDSSEVVHHIDYDFTNNVLENLEVIRRADHSRLHNDKGLGSTTNRKAYDAKWRDEHRLEINRKMREWRAHIKAAK